MFIKPKPFQGPPGSTVSYEVRYAKGRKPFATRAEADAFAQDQRAAEDGWAEVAQIIRIVVDARA